jgi:hypothetical protein
MMVKTFIFERDEIKKIDTTINDFMQNKRVISITIGVSPGNMLGGGGIVYSILYEERMI